MLENQAKFKRIMLRTVIKNTYEAIAYLIGIPALLDTFITRYINNPNEMKRRPKEITNQNLRISSFISTL